MKRRILAALITLVMLLGLLPGAAFASAGGTETPIYAKSVTIEHILGPDGGQSTSNGADFKNNVAYGQKAPGDIGGDVKTIYVTYEADGDIGENKPDLYWGYWSAQGSFEEVWNKYSQGSSEPGDSDRNPAPIDLNTVYTLFIMFGATEPVLHVNEQTEVTINGKKAVYLGAATGGGVKYGIQWQNGSFLDSVATVVAQAGTGGSTSGGGEYALGKEATLIATPSTGYSFDGWYQGQSKVSGNSSYTFRVKQAGTHTYEARFALNNYSVTLTVPTDGHWSADSTTKSVTHDGTVTFTLTPAEGYTFEGVQLPTGDGIEYTLNDDGTVAAALSNVTEDTTINSSLKAVQAAFTITLQKPTGAHWENANGETVTGLSVENGATSEEVYLVAEEGYFWETAPTVTGTGVTTSGAAISGLKYGPITISPTGDVTVSSTGATLAEAKWTTDSGTSWTYGELSDALTAAVNEGDKIQILTAVNLPTGTLKKGVSIQDIDDKTFTSEDDATAIVVEEGRVTGLTAGTLVCPEAVEIVVGTEPGTTVTTLKDDTKITVGDPGGEPQLITGGITLPEGETTGVVVGEEIISVTAEGEDIDVYNPAFPTAGPKYPTVTVPGGGSAEVTLPGDPEDVNVTLPGPGTGEPGENTYVIIPGTGEPKTEPVVGLISGKVEIGEEDEDLTFIPGNFPGEPGKPVDPMVIKPVTDAKVTVTAGDPEAGKAKVEIDPNATEPGITIGGKIYPITGEPGDPTPSLVIDEDGDVITDNGSVDLGKEPDGTDSIFIPQTGDPDKKLISVVPNPITGVKNGPATVTTEQPGGTTTIVLPPDVSVEIGGVIYTGKGPAPGGELTIDPNGKITVKKTGDPDEPGGGITATVDPEDPAYPITMIPGVEYEINGYIYTTEDENVTLGAQVGGQTADESGNPYVELPGGGKINVAVKADPEKNTDYVANNKGVQFHMTKPGDQADDTKINLIGKTQGESGLQFGPDADSGIDPVKGITIDGIKYVGEEDNAFEVLWGTKEVEVKNPDYDPDGPEGGENPETIKVTVPANKITGIDGDDKVTATFDEKDLTLVIPNTGKVNGTAAPDGGDAFPFVSVTGGISIVITAGEDGKVAVGPGPGSAIRMVTDPETGDVRYEVERVTSSGDKIWAKNCPKNQLCPIHPFVDAETTAWYHNGVHYCLDEGLMQGVGNQKFVPGGAHSRAMMAQLLYNLAGKPAVSGKSPFSDVADDAWYADAVIWATAEGVVDGHGDGTYAPEDNISREQLAKIFYNYAKMKGLDVSGGQNVDLNSFADGDQVSAWAQDAICWAVGNGLMQGKGNAVLDPAGSATRAEVAEMMMNFCLEILKK